MLHLEDLIVCTALDAALNVFGEAIKGFITSQAGHDLTRMLN